MLTRVLPIYGNGWTNGHITVDEPLSFFVEIDDNEIGDFSGRIIGKDNELNGHSFTASRRHSEDESFYTCQIFSENKLVLQGYCMFESFRKDAPATE